MKRLKIPKVKFNDFRFGKAEKTPPIEVHQVNKRAETIRKRNEYKSYAETTLKREG